MRFMLPLIFMILASSHSAVHAMTTNSFNAEYEITRGSMVFGNLKRTLVINDENKYELISQMSAKGLADLFLKLDSTEVSHGKIIDGKVMPETFSYSRKGKKEKNFSVNFDYDVSTVSNPSGKYAWKAEISTLVLDKLSYQLQLMLDLEHSPAEIHYTIADRKGLKAYIIKKIHSETIYTGLGPISATKVRRDSEKSKTVTSVWCAPKLGWIPVKVEHKDKKGNITTALLKRLESKTNGIRTSQQ